MTHEHPHQKDEKLTYWRSVDNLHRTETYIKSIESEFEGGQQSEISGLQRRSMLKLMGASMAFAGMGVACRRPEAKILPYTKQPEDIVPGKPNYYATVIADGLDAVGVLVESHEGRPTKIEGNPDHHGSLGKADMAMQASVLELYDPDRSVTPTQAFKGQRMPSNWIEWDMFAEEHFAKLAERDGEGLYFLTTRTPSPTHLRLEKELKKRFAKAVFFAYDPLALDNTQAGAALAFGRPARVHYHLEQAQVILTLQADPLMTGPEHLLHASGFAERRRVYDTSDVSKMNRLYAVEAACTVTGSNADHRFRLSAAQTGDFLRALARELFGVLGLTLPVCCKDGGIKAALLDQVASAPAFDKKFIAALAKDLKANMGHSVIIVGENQAPAVHALAHVINMALGGEGSTFSLTEPSMVVCTERSADQCRDLVKSLNDGKVDTLVMLDVNPAYNAPGALGFAKALAKAKTSIHVGLYEDETGRVASWHLPMAHFLETWSDAVSYKGVASIGQPLIAPLHAGRSTLEVLAQIAGIADRKPHALVQTTWRQGSGVLAAEKTWRKALHEGVIPGSLSAKVASPKVDTPAVVKALSSLAGKAPTAQALEVVVMPSYTLRDGRLANLSWLQEMPDPVTKIVWANAMWIGPAFAKKIGLTSGLDKRKYMGELVELSANGVTLQMPAYVVPGLPDYSVTLVLGYGRTASGVVGNGVGVDVYPMLPADGAKVFQGATLKRLNTRQAVPTTQEQFAMNGEVLQETNVLSMQGRDPATLMTTQEYVRHPNAASAKNDLKPDLMQKQGSELEPIQMTKSWEYTGNKWGMLIDLASCIGCNACVTACVAENNIPVVGPEQVMRGRMLHWLRVDSYKVGPVEEPRTILQPVPCMHCENAPCESVCPVAATTHDKEGLNVMTYNRCVGTRYCGNNCPYKVRRFNYFDFSNSGDIYVAPEKKERRKLLQMQYNPDVTVRYRGVMEKCTYCTQRIQEAKIEALRQKQDPNALPDGAVTPACAQTCPTQAIVFGNLNDPTSKVSKLKQGNRNYTMLNELNVRPRTSYLSRLFNPNPELV